MFVNNRVHEQATVKATAKGREKQVAHANRMGRVTSEK